MQVLEKVCIFIMRNSVFKIILTPYNHIICLVALLEQLKSNVPDDAIPIEFITRSKNAETNKKALADLLSNLSDSFDGVCFFYHFSHFNLFFFLLINSLI